MRWLELIGALDGNASAVEVRWFTPEIAATIARALPDVVWMQHVAGLAQGDAALVPDIAAWYEASGVRPRFEIAPMLDFAPLASVLTACGARQSGFIDALWMRAHRPPVTEARSPITIRVVESGSDDASRFAHVHLEGHGVPAEAIEAHWRAVAAWASEPGWRCYLAEVDGEPVAVGALALIDGIGYLANASTLPAARGRGCQQALIARRVHDATDDGCDIVLSVANPGSSSHRNLQRAGLVPAYTKVVWTVEQ